MSEIPLWKVGAEESKVLIEGIPQQLRDCFSKALTSQKIILEDASLGSEEVVGLIIPFLNRCPRVVDLDVRYNQIDNEGAIALARNSTLTSLNFGSNQIGKQGAIALAQNTNLITLDIGYNRIGDEGVTALVPWMYIYNGKDFRNFIQNGILGT